MNRTIFLFLSTLLLLFSAHACLARSGSIAALAVTEDNATNGTIAELHLEIRPGNGAIYIESFPLTKLDTQLSTRFANEIACQLWGKDCSQYDFFYVIDTKSSVIGGPSAGGALTVLTYAVLSDIRIDNTTAMTGSILSGGIIGPVGGVRGKVAGAAENGYTQVIIPALETNDSGIPLADRYDINIVRVHTITEAIQSFTGEKPPVRETPQIPQQYTEQMQSVATDLCFHADVLADQFNNTVPLDLNSTEREQWFNESATAQKARARAHATFEHGAYYSAASQCFSAATIYHRLVLQVADNETLATEEARARTVHAKLTELLEEQKLNTVADLEVAMIVTERLSDAKQVLTDLSNESTRAAAIAYASERLETARAWMRLFGSLESQALNLHPLELATSCNRKIAEAQERINYVTYVYPLGASVADESLRTAFADAQTHEYTLCLLHASQAKAEAAALITAVQVPEEDYPVVVREKINSANTILAQQKMRGAFPILGYSYAEYANELLADDDKFSASLYAEYSLEFTALDIYFSPKRSFILEPQLLLLFGTGAFFGIVIGLFAGYQLWKTQKTHRPKKVPIARNLPGKKR